MKKKNDDEDLDLFKSLITLHASKQKIEPSAVIEGLINGKQSFKTFGDASLLLLGKPLEFEFIKSLQVAANSTHSKLAQFLYASFFTTPIKEKKMKSFRGKYNMFMQE